DRGRYGRTTRSRLRVRDVGIGSGVDVVRVGGTKSGNVDGRRLILGQGEVRCIGRLGVEAARRQSLELSLVGTGAVAEKPSLTDDRHGATAATGGRYRWVLAGAG